MAKKILEKLDHFYYFAIGYPLAVIFLKALKIIDPSAFQFGLLMVLPVGVVALYVFGLIKKEVEKDQNSPEDT